MSKEKNRLVFSKGTDIELGSNHFIDVPVILQYKETPLISVVNELDVGYTTSIPIYHPDGTYLAKVKGSQLYLTKDGEKSGLKLRHEDKITVCELDGKTVFEIRRMEAAALKTSAELYVPDGKLIKYNDSHPLLLSNSNEEIRIGGMVMTRCTFQGCSIGILINDNGISMGIS